MRVKDFTRFHEDALVAIRHPGGGYTSLHMKADFSPLATNIDYEPSDTIGELFPDDGEPNTVVLEMATEKRERGLFFCHIPKTAGGALSRSLRGLFRDRNIIAFESGADLFRMSDRELATGSLVMGHSGAFTAHRLPPETLTMVVLRDPVKRVLSTYNFFLANKVIEPGLMDFLKRPGNKWAVENLMTWQLVHDHTTAGRRSEPYRDWSDEKMKNAAFDALHRFNIIGVAEQIGEVLDRLEVVYERAPLPLERVNEVKKVADEPTEEEIALIREKNMIDQDLYDEAVRIKDEIWERTRAEVTSVKPTNHFL